MLALAALVLALPRSDTAAEAERGSVLRIGWLVSPDNLNVFSDSTAAEIVMLNYDMLTRWDAATLRVKPALAASWTHSPDDKVWTFHLRRGVRWQDGRPFTAADVVFTFEYVLHNKPPNGSAWVDSISKVVAVDDSTVRFFCTRPKGDILSMQVPIVPAHIWSRMGGEMAANTLPRLPIIGTGPFSVVDYRSDDYVRLVANDDYWRGRPRVSEIVFETYQNSDTMVADLLAGRLQAAINIPPASVPRLRRRPAFAVITADPFMAVDTLTFNCYAGPASRGDPVLRDPAFRRALAYAVDSPTIARTAYGGLAVPASTVVVAGFFRHPDWHWPAPAGERRSFDLATANALLDQAGYRRDAQGSRCRHGRPIRLRLFAPTGMRQWPLAAALIAGRLRELGLDVKLTVMSDDQLVARMWNESGQAFAPDFDLAMWGVSGSPDPSEMLATFTTGQIGCWNPCGWSNATYDRLYRAQAATFDPRRRQRLIWAMQRLLEREEPVVPVVSPELPIAYDVGGWTGWVRSPAGRGQAIYGAYSADSYVRVHPLPSVDAGAHATHGRPVLLAVAGALVAAAVWAAAGARRPRPLETP